MCLPLSPYQIDRSGRFFSWLVGPTWAGYMVSRDNISRTYHCPNSMACLGGAGNGNQLGMIHLQNHGKLHNDLGLYIYNVKYIPRVILWHPHKGITRMFTVGYKGPTPRRSLIMLNDHTVCSPTLQEIFQMKQKPCAGAVIQGLVVSNAILGLHHPALPVVLSRSMGGTL